MPRLTLVASLLLPCVAVAADPPKMKVNQVREISPVVFTRYSAISQIDSSAFGGEKKIMAMKKGVFLLDAVSPSLIDLDALARLAPGRGPGVGLDAVNRESPSLAPLRKLGGAVMTSAAREPDPEADERRRRLLRENLRRFAAGEALLGVVGR